MSKLKIGISLIALLIVFSSRTTFSQPFTGSALIEVPSITIGGFKAGSVWFTVQSDVGFQSVLGSLMDKPIKGALGGSALHYLRMTVDWPNGIATQLQNRER